MGDDLQRGRGNFGGRHLPDKPNIHNNCDMDWIHDCFVGLVLCTSLFFALYDFLNERNDIHWYCDKCEPKVLRSIQMDKKLKRSWIFFGLRLMIDCHR